MSELKMQMARETKKVALVDGEKIEYDLAAKKVSAYKFERENGTVRYLGSGVIYSIDGAKQSGKDKYYFWRKVAP